MDLRTIFIVWVVTSISLYIISKLPILGVEIDPPLNPFISAAVLGIVTAVIRPILLVAFAPLNIVAVDLLSDFLTFIITVVCFGLAARLVEGFRLRFGIGSAVIGAFTLSIVSSLIYGLLGVRR